MPQKIDIDTWKRKDLFNFFKEYQDPFFNITGQVDVTELYYQCREDGHSLFLSSLYFAVHTANLIEEFRMRLKDGELFVYDRIEAGCTILHEDNTFGFCYFPYEGSLNKFVEQGRLNIAAQKKHKVLDPHLNQLDIIHFSTIPWVAFTSFKHARRQGVEDSIPKIVFGKVCEIDRRMKMPVSVEVHHAICDGFHVGKYFEVFENLIKDGYPIE